MTAEDLADGLEATGYPVTYYEWAPGQEPDKPYIVYLFVESADMLADNENYQAISDYHVELYTTNKDPTAEAAVEGELRTLGLAWSKSETKIPSEAMFQILYTVRIVESESEESVS
jgi:hypothetical protein